ncbi:MAG: hypothetical protein IH985_03700 [Planctomycetes bacterium]|nr:hypothetical protein [Planctomycetota bacterium]
MSNTRTIVGLALIPGFMALGGPLGIQPAPQPCQLETSFDGHKSTPSGGAAYFGITVQSQPIEITSLDLNLSTDAGVPFQIEVYTTPDTWIGKEQDPSQWTLRTTGAGTSAGRGQASSAPLVGALALDADTSFGLAIVVTGGGALVSQWQREQRVLQQLGSEHHHGVDVVHRVLVDTVPPARLERHRAVHVGDLRVPVRVRLRSGSGVRYLRLPGFPDRVRRQRAVRVRARP